MQIKCAKEWLKWIKHARKGGASSNKRGVEIKKSELGLMGAGALGSDRFGGRFGLVPRAGLDHGFKGWEIGRLID
jgi:hypothetical protein